MEGLDDTVEEVAMEMEDSGGNKEDGNDLDKFVGKGRNSKYMTLLPEDFEPGDMDVLCGRGKRCFNSPVSTVVLGCYCCSDLLEEILTRC